MKKALTLLLFCILSMQTYAEQKDSAPFNPIYLSHVKDAVPTPLNYSPYGNPDSYEVNGKTYHVLKSNNGYEAEGYASWYGTKFQGKRTSSGEPYNMYTMTAASPVLPIPSFVQVTNLENNKSVIVKVNDRGPFHDGRIMDLSYAAASKLDMLHDGTAFVKIIAIDTGVPAIHEISQHFLQVAAFSNNTSAQQLVAKLEPVIQSPITLASIQRDDKTLYRVLIGPVTNKEIPKLQTTLQHNGFSKGFTISNVLKT